MNHLLPYFAEHRLSQITVAEVDRYRQSKVAEGERIRQAAEAGKPIVVKVIDKNGRERVRPAQPLSAVSINKSLTRLGQILDMAFEYRVRPPRIPSR